MKLKIFIVTFFIASSAFAQTTNLDTIESQMLYAAKEG
jgi:hypothetical protein